MANQKITDLVQIETISSDDVLPIVDISDNITKKIDITQIKAQSPVQSVNATTGDVTVQATLVSGTNIKTINSTSILGSGNLVVAAAPSGVSGSVQFSDGSALASDATNFFWDNTNDRLGIGTNTPSDRLTILGNSTSPIRASFRNTNANGDTQISLKNDTTGAAGFQVTGTTYFGNPSAYFFTQGGLEKLSFTTDGDLAAGGSGFITFLTGGYNASQERMRILSNGNIGINSTTATSKLVIKGSGATSATSSVSVINSASTSLLYVGDDGKVGVGTASPTAALDVSSTTQGFLPPRMTTAQRDAIATPATGLVVYNTSTNSHNFYNGTAWKALAVASGVAGQVQFSDGTNLASTGNLFWRSDTNQLGINVSTVTNALDVNGNAFIGNNTGTTGTARLTVKGGGASAGTINTLWTNSVSASLGNVNCAGDIFLIGNGSFGNPTVTARLNVKGSGATSATNSVLVQNSSSSQTFSVRDDGVVFVGLGGLAVGSAKFQVKDQSDNICISVAQSDILFGNSAVLRSNDGIMYPTGNITFRNGNPNSAVINFGDSEINSVSATGVFSFIKFTRNWTSVAPSLNLTINVQETQNVINMTNGTGTKIFRGIYHNPTVTAVTSHRAFESSSGGGHFNTTSVDASSVLQADSTTQGFLMPRMTTTQRDAIATPATGLSIYNTTTNSVNYYNGTAWEDTKLVVTNRQIASYTLAITDANKLVEINNASANNLTVPLNSSVAYSIGTQILLAQYGAGQTTVVATGGVTIRSSGGKLKLTAQYSGATLIKIATDEWYLFGDISV